MNTSDQDQVPFSSPGIQARRLHIADTTSVCSRNKISDITFYDSTNFVLNPSSDQISRFPFSFYTERTRTENAIRVRYFQSLREGEKITTEPLQNDWLVIIILVSAFLYSVIRSSLTKNFSALSRFFLLRGIGDSGSRDTGAIFHPGSTLINLVSFINIALFIYCLAWFYDLFPAGFSRFLAWLIIMGCVVTAVTGRHIICFITGSLSNQREIFNEYTVVIYQSYQYAAFVLLLIVVFISYTSILPVTTLIYTGILVYMILYIIRLIRLFLIFMNRNVSILYLILYLCALEFLPVVVLIKFLTGQF